VQAAETEIVLLWSCFGGRHHPVLGSLAEALLSETQRRAGVVLASHAAVRGTAVPRILKALLRALQGRAAGNLELAVSLARQDLEEGDLQWAVPAYCAANFVDPGLELTHSGRPRSRGVWADDDSARRGSV
jgi:hypothetical protein